MYILEIIPFLALPRNQTQLLTYFSDKPLVMGSLVELLIRNRKTLGIVLRSESLKNLKISLRKEADFSIKPISKIISTDPVISSAQLKTAFWLSSQYFAPLGLCLKTVLPPFFNKKRYPLFSFPDKKSALSGKPHKIILTSSLKNHYKDYEKEIAAAKNRQILLVVPERSYLGYFHDKYKDYNPEIIHSGINHKKFHEVYKKASSGEALLVIGTRIASFLPFSNLGLIILDNESNDSSRSDTTPRYDTRELLSYLAKEHGATLIINDLVPKADLLVNYRHETKINLPHPPQFISLVDEIKNKNFSPLSRDLQSAILSATDHRQKVILFIPRKGYARSLICKNCSGAISCPDCSASMVVHDLSPDKKILKCHHCQKEQDLIKVCPRCKNFMLEYQGLGTQKVIQKIKVLFERHHKKSPVILELSNDSAPRELDEEVIIDQFQKTAPVIMVATQKIFSWQYLLKADLVGIVNMELSSIFPDFRTEERTLRHLATLAQMGDQIIIQGYNPDSPALKTLRQNNIAGFLEEELRTRKIFSYPPFSELIKLTLKHKNSAFLKEARVLAEKFKIELKNKGLGKEVTVIGPQAGLITKEKGLYVWNIFLKVKNLETKKRNELLRLVPSRYWRVEVNPKEIL